MIHVDPALFAPATVSGDHSVTVDGFLALFAAASSSLSAGDIEGAAALLADEAAALEVPPADDGSVDGSTSAVLPWTTAQLGAALAAALSSHQATPADAADRSPADTAGELPEVSADDSTGQEPTAQVLPPQAPEAEGAADLLVATTPVPPTQPPDPSVESDPVGHTPAPATAAAPPAPGTGVDPDLSAGDQTTLTDATVTGTATAADGGGTETGATAEPEPLRPATVLRSVRSDAVDGADPVEPAPAPSPGGARDTGEVGATRMSSLARTIERIAEAAARLEHAPPPRQVTLELGEVRLRLAVEDGGLRVQILGDQDGRELLRDLNGALRSRGFSLADDRGGDHRGRQDDGARDEQPPADRGGRARPVGRPDAGLKL